jgi:hypothetical protein
VKGPATREGARPEDGAGARGAPALAESAGVKRKTRSKTRTVKPGAGLAGSAEAKRRASLVLEVLSGLRSPLDASLVLDLNLQRYYQLEARALQGLVEALELKPAGRQPSPDGELRRARAERDRLGRELLRAQALLRASHRAIGVTPPETAREKVAPTTGKRRRKRPTVRARRAAARLRAEADAAPPPAPPNPPSPAQG